MEWISVKDRLPENGEPVLIKELFEEEIQIASYVEDFGWTEQTVNHICNGNAYCEFTVFNVTHWMPLPQSPKDAE